MKSEIITLPERYFAGLTARTNNQAEFNQTHAKIGKTISEYVDLYSVISEHLSHPHHFISAYTEYESNEHSNYTYFFGQEIKSESEVPQDFAKLIIPKQTYVKFTTPYGNKVQMVIEAWQAIWKMNEEELRGKRKYTTDFEYYDERASDPEHSQIDIYIAIE